jgi:hypothetical protein
LRLNRVMANEGCMRRFVRMEVSSVSGIKWVFLVGFFSSVTFGVLAGCGADPPVPDDGANESPAPGEEAGACFPDGTCNEGLECEDGVCVRIAGEGEDEGEEITLLIFHNNSGPMCLAALEWLDGAQAEHSTLVIEEHLTYEPGERELLAQLEAEYPTSQGVSTSFGYLPIVFFGEQAFSGFNEEVSQMLQDLMDVAEGASP